MNETKNIINRDIAGTTAKDIIAADEGDFIKLKAAAKIFLDQIKITSDMYEKASNKKKLREKISVLYSNMREESSYTQNILKHQHNFETALNNFLGRTIYLTYVADEGKINFYGEINIGKIYQEATANRGRGNISEGKMFDANDLQKSIQEDIERSRINKVRVYQEALSRYHKNDDEKYMNYNISKRTFY